MANCLGLYIENNLIKYAKVSKEHEKLKIESFGVKFYDNLDKAIGQIIQETDSTKTPISTNLTDEMYNYFDMFALLNNKDLTKAIGTEFELYCSDKGYNPNVFVTKYAVANNPEDKEKLRVIHIAENKIELSKKTQQFSGYKLSNITSMPMCIPNLLETQPRENCLIVNIEDKTTVTTIYDQKIYDVKILEKGSEEFLNKINARENSYAKSYEICKNTTIYTTDDAGMLGTDENGYLDDIMPTIFDITTQIKNIIKDSVQTISKVYITGTATLINNMDLYFQEYLPEVECEILKPYFVSTGNDISIKDYIEVNSAISLALTGLGNGITGINFKEKSFSDSIPDWLKIDIGGGKQTNKGKLNKNIDLSKIFRNDLGERLDRTEFALLRTAIGLLLVFIVYSVFSVAIGNQIDNRSTQANESIRNTNSQISLAESDNQKIRSRTNEYSTMIQNLQDLNDKISDINRNKKVIPILLNSIMNIIPENVQLTSIQNTTDRHIVIEAQSDKYEQLGMFKAKIQNDSILTNVISTAGQKDNSVVTVKIEGDLP